ncbi:box C/D snoRNA protein 1-like [Anopheles merus]|uniref:box C/D snoRNA protein 1-like n=1 Tax=Anopheles merus TaxID=30066 RepID=UPI001BE3D7A5|nr:box C/D snoRNA protein 1-like [Anopheles merus]
MASTVSIKANAEHSTILGKRLGYCEACSANAAKYTCPRCDVKTCSMECLNIHKAELKCNGIRDRTKYIPLVKMTKMDLMNDYYFLEDCTKFVQNRKRDQRKRFTCLQKNLPIHMMRLQQAALDRGIALKFMLQNFSKRQKKYILIEWCFPQTNENYVYIDKHICEDSKLCDIVDTYLQPSSKHIIPGVNKLANYQARGVAGVSLLLKAEGVQQSYDRVTLLNIHDTLRESLQGKTIVEYPTIYVVLNDQLDQFHIIDSDDDLKHEICHINHILHRCSGVQPYNGGCLINAKNERKNRSKRINFFSFEMLPNDSSDSDDATLNEHFKAT